ncbi:MAG TPA: hypothetical protein VLE43_00945 [Candidatus Saccharimonadia bacterium]|nr:hypothetical protein [Candidatus Saccharimonadia bacterium]
MNNTNTMHHRLHFSSLPLLLSCMLCFCGAGKSLMAEDSTERGFALMNKESLGSLKLEMSAKDITALLGKPEKTGKDIEWEALGEFVQQWSWPKAGITAEMISEKKGGSKKVLMFTAKAPWDKTTSKGIRIGSTETEVRAAYGTYEDKEMSEAGSTFIAGSVYGGLQFTFSKGKVTAIFFGASAE